MQKVSHENNYYINQKDNQRLIIKTIVKLKSNPTLRWGKFEQYQLNLIK